jgi:hypothetical protein
MRDPPQRIPEGSGEREETVLGGFSQEALIEAVNVATDLCRVRNRARVSD